VSSTEHFNQEVAMSRVFVLGSGFSVRAGAPLSRSILSSLFRQDKSAPRLLDLKLYIDRFLFPGRPDWVTKADFEEVLSRLDLIRHYQPYPNIDYNQVSYYEDLLISEFTKLLNPEHLSQRHSSYDIFTRLLEPQDIVISFNYDLVLESLLTSAGIDFNYCLKSQISTSKNKALRLLKLHGSINLYYCPRCSQVVFFSQQMTRHPVTYGSKAKFNPDLTADSLICGQCSTIDKIVVLRHFIIAPTLFKSVTLPALRRLWFTALQALSGASQIFIIGYSMPVADILSHQLFDFAQKMSTQNQDIYMINGPRAASESFLHIYGDRLKNEKVYFEHWTEQLVLN
jgi:NAD-dependent SIR2 family protein deacetylase